MPVKKVNDHFGSHRCLHKLNQTVDFAVVHSTSGILACVQARIQHACQHPLSMYALQSRAQDATFGGCYCTSSSLRNVMVSGKRWNVSMKATWTLADFR